MKLRIDIENVHEEIEAPTAEVALSKVKAEAAARAPWMLRGAIKAMSDLGFAGEAVKMHNRKNGASDAAPANAQEFLDWAQSHGYVSQLPDTPVEL